ncbi:MAG TPA: AAA family ATPase [Bryobacteraceae bacterium]|nr:AAA family ATPase [Bryobacteraceae bacterium]
MMAAKKQRSDELPANAEAERVILGYLLAGGAWPAGVGVRDFSLEIHQILYRAMALIHAAEERIDLPRLKVQLTERELKHIGIGYLADLISSGCYAEMWIAPYVEKLKEATCKRDLLHHAHILTAHIHSNDRTAAELLAMGAEAFAGLASASVNGHFSYRDVKSIWRWEADVQWIVDGLIPEGAITLLTGDSGHGKTIFATALAGAIAHGRDFMGRATARRAVLYCDRENPAAVVKQHLHDLDIQETDWLVFWGNWCPQEADGPESASLLEFARQHKPVFIFDPAIAFNRGDEQSSNDTRAFMNHCRRLASAGATVILLHHVGKSEKSKDYRGSSDYKAAVDMAYLLEKLGDAGGPLAELRLVPFKNRFTGGETLLLSFRDGRFRSGERRETASEIVERLVRDHQGDSLRNLVALARSEGLSKHQAEEQFSRGVKDARFEVRQAGRGHGYFLRDQLYDA